jgi:hypothetical protein
MAPPFSLKLGSLDLAQYLRIGNDEGFDPYDQGGFEEPAFIDNPFGEGQGLANVDSRNREMSWPLYLKATSKDNLHTLVRQINQEIHYAARPLRVEWKDQDATNSTFYDVEFARFDPNFRMRPSAQKWLAGVLRVWTRPYGHTATWRTVATSAATMGVSSHAVPSIAGDMDAHLRVTVGASRAAAAVSSYGYIFTAIGVVPPSWKGFVAPASQGSFPATGASGTLASTIIRTTFPPASSSISHEFYVAASPHYGRMRVFDVLRCSTASRIFDAYTYTSSGDYTLTRYAAPVPSQWFLVDLGVVTVPTQFTGATYRIQVISLTGSAAASGAMEVAGTFLFPEDSTVAVMDGVFQNQFVVDNLSATYVFNGEDGDISRTATRVSDPGLSADRLYGPLSGVGVIPGVVPGASQSVLVAHVALGHDAPQNTPLAVSIEARERFTFAR